jgi:hypothetical protein
LPSSQLIPIDLKTLLPKYNSKEDTMAKKGKKQKKEAKKGIPKEKKKKPNVCEFC